MLNLPETARVFEWQKQGIVCHRDTAIQRPDLQITEKPNHQGFQKDLGAGIGINEQKFFILI